MNWWWRVLGFVFVATKTGGRNTEISISIIMLVDRVIHNFWETVKSLLYFVKKLNYQLIVLVWSVSPEILTEMSRSPAHNTLNTVNKPLSAPATTSHLLNAPTDPVPGARTGRQTRSCQGPNVTKKLFPFIRPSQQQLIQHEEWITWSAVWPELYKADWHSESRNYSSPFKYSTLMKERKKKAWTVVST